MSKTQKETISALLDQIKDRLTYSRIMERFYQRKILTGSNVQANEQVLAQTQDEIKRSQELFDFLLEIDKEEPTPDN